MAYGGKIDFGIGFKVDESGINKLRQELESISKLSATSIQKMCSRTIRKTLKWKNMHFHIARAAR